jgi:4-amino-4-deoxy-L-arabinose transferase-like glycosyltransferase
MTSTTSEKAIDWMGSRVEAAPTGRKPADHRRFWCAVLGLLVLAAALRIPRLSSLPAGFYADEAVYGYEAYSVSQTFRDRYGHFLPVFFRALDDDREGTFIYLLIPFEKVFGLNEFGERLPAALIGILTVLAVCMLARELFDERIALLSGLMLAISPWGIHFSRIGYRAVLLPLVFTASMALFARSFRRPWFILWSALAFCLCMHTYMSARVLVPLTCCGLVILFPRLFLAHRRQAVIAGAFLLLLALIVAPHWLSPAGMERSRHVGINIHPLRLVKNYLLYLRPRFLFLGGDVQPRQSTGSIGELLPVEMVFVPVGLLALFWHRVEARRLMLLWLVLYPVPGFVAYPPSAVRAMVGAPLFAILSACGIAALVQLAGRRWRVFAWSMVSIALTLSFAIFAWAYYGNFAARSAHAFRFGMRDILAFAESTKERYPHVFVSDNLQFSRDFILFYTKFPPAEFQKAQVMPSQMTGYTIGRYEVGSVQTRELGTQPELWLIEPSDIHSLFVRGLHWRTLDTVREPSGPIAAMAVEVLPQQP